MQPNPQNTKGVPLVAAAVIVFSLMVQPSHAVSCGQVDAALISCVGYLTGRVDTPPKACCDGVATVKGLAKTPEDKKDCCNCLKAAAGRHEDLKDAAAKSLPTKCGVQFDIPISRDVDCDNIKAAMVIDDSYGATVKSSS